MGKTRVSGVMVAAALWMTLLTGPAWATDDVFRCGSNTVDRGYTTVHVLNLCGKPDLKLPAHRAGLPGKERTRQGCAP